MAELFSNEYFMKQALNEAKKAAELGEVPVGAIIVANNLVIAKAHNQVQLLEDVTAHAEILAITSASTYLGAKYLKDCTLYVTLEPCIMCAGALKWSQIGKIIYGAADEQNGFMKYGKELLHTKTKVEYGVMHDECSHLIKSFFQAKRNQEKS